MHVNVPLLCFLPLEEEGSRDGEKEEKEEKEERQEAVVASHAA